MQPPPTEVEQLAFHLIDRLEKAFDACAHPYNDGGEPQWCNVCGAFGPGLTLKPHWRDILVRTLLAR